MEGGLIPLPDDTWKMCLPAKGRVARTGIVEMGQGRRHHHRGNSSPGAKPSSKVDRNGDGVHRKRRLTHQIYAVRNWL